MPYGGKGLPVLDKTAERNVVAGLLTVMALLLMEAWGQKAVPVTSVRVRDER